LSELPGAGLEGASITYPGENVAVGFETPEDVMEAWHNSPGHRANIENPAFVRMGVGNYQWRWTQLFAR